MEAIKNFLNNITDQINNFIKPIWDKMIGLINGDMYVLYAAIAIIVAIILLAGLIACLKKIPKLFIAIIILLAIVVVVWFFAVYKPSKSEIGLFDNLQNNLLYKII